MSMLSNKIIMNVETTSNLTLILATIWIINQRFPSRSTGPALIGQYAATKAAHMEHSYLIENILLEVSRAPTIATLLEANNFYDGSQSDLHYFFTDLSNEELFYRLNKVKAKVILFVDSLKSFERLEADILKKRNFYDRNGYFVVLYTGREPYPLDSIRIIFERLFQIYVIHVNVLIASEQTVYTYTYFPFTKTACHNSEPHFHGIFAPITNYRYSEKYFFTKKTLNMWGCQLYVTTWTEPPFIKLDYNKTTGRLISLEGIEGKLMKLLAAHMNFTIQIVEEPGRRVGNGTEPGAIKMLHDGLTNISLCGLQYNKARQSVAQPSYSYLNAPISLGIPLGRRLAPLERLIHPLSYTVWSYIIFGLLLGVGIIFTLKVFYTTKTQELVFGAGNRQPFTNLWNTFYGGTVDSIPPRQNLARYLLAVWILYSLVIRSAYLAQLFNILQDSSTRSNLNTISKVLKQNFTIYSYPVSVPVLLDAGANDMNIKYLTANQSVMHPLFKCLAEDENANIVVVAQGYNIKVYNENPKNRRRRVNILRESLINTPLTLYMRKHSYLYNVINDILLNIVSTGLIKRFEDLTLPSETYITKETKAPASISIASLVGLFYVYFVLLFLSSLIFLLELWSKRSPLTRRFIDVINC